jgi:hypothetical protein
MLSLLQKPMVQMAVLGVVVAAAAAFFLTQDSRGGAVAPATATEAATKAATPPPKNMGQAATEAVPVSRAEVKGIQVAETAPVAQLVLPEASKPPPPTIAKEEPKKAEKPKPVVFPDLVQLSAKSTPKAFVPQAPKIFAPRGTLIKATLVITLESNAAGTPVLGLVNEDVYFQGELIVPAGTQVHGSSVGKSNFRDRVDVRGAFTFIWADGSEYVINGIALDHQPLPDGTFSLTDGSPGIKGRVLKTDDYAEFKLLVAEAVKGLMNNQQSQFQSVMGLVPENTNRNASLGAGSSAAGAYAGMLAGRIEKDLEYVQVPAGTSFYIFTLDVFEPELRSIAGIRQGNKPLNSVEEQLASHQQATVATELTESEMRQRLESARVVNQAIMKSEQQQEQMDRTSALFAPTSGRPSAPPTKPSAP